MTFACFVSDKHEPVCGNSCTLGIASSHSSSLTIETKTIGGNIKVHNPPAVICCALNVILNGLSECIPGFFATYSDLWRSYWRLSRLDYRDGWYDGLMFVQKFFTDGEYSLLHIRVRPVLT